MAIQNRYAFSANAQSAFRLGAFGNFQRVFAFQCWNANFRSQRGLGVRDRYHAMQIVAFTLEERMLFHVQNNIKIACPTTMHAAFTKARETNSSSILDARGNLCVDGSLPQNAPFSFALWTRIGDYAARALAGRACARNAEETLLIPDLSATTARPVGGGRFAGRGA